MRLVCFIITLLFGCTALAQDEVLTQKPVDSLYREDQFYFNVSYNNLQNLPTGLSKSKFSPGFSIGFLRDMPINKDRTLAVAAGLGYSLNIFNDNLYTYNSDNGNGTFTTTYEIISPDIFYSKNKLALSYIDLPIEIRWRSSTPESHKFWRIYSGFKVSYLIADSYKFTNDIGTTVIKHNADLNKIQYGCYLTVGWNSVNFYAYYGLNPIYKSAAIGSEKIKMNTFNLGFQFYIL